MKNTLGLLVLLAAITTLIGCKPANNAKVVTTEPAEQVHPISASRSPVLKQIERVTQSEHLLQALSSKMKVIGKAFREKVDTDEVVFPNFQYVGLDDESFEQRMKALTSTKKLASFYEWPIQADAAEANNLTQVWTPIMKDHFLQDSQIGVLRGAFSDDYKTFEMDTKFEGRIQLDDGLMCGIKGWQTLTWKEDGIDNWKIAEWKQTKLKLVGSSLPLFHDVTSQVIPDEELQKSIRRSSHEELIVERSRQLNTNLSIRDADPEYPWFSDWESTSHYPSVSVVDFDNDGDDDIFLTDRWAPPQLLRNDGDGTFSDSTEASGVDLDKYVSCGYFFDYDNDGDADLLIGRTVKGSLFYENKEGRFVPHEVINKVLEQTRMVLSVASADVNNDGLLDLYLCTYCSPSGSMDEWIQHVARPQDRVKTRLKIERSNRYVDRGGPPNILLMNQGDTFVWSNIGDDLKQFRCSYQGSWSDFDNDGDQDLYVCNDFSADVFLRNDTPKGSFAPKFVDVTAEIAPTVKMGFGMGSSFGDYDSDGDLDLYICNMYSKAGNRIIAQLEDVDERLTVSARGNFLYENDGGRFTQVAGEGPDQQHINVVGWSFGGQFADLDNDGHLDLFVPSGFYSAPQEVKTDLDL